MRLKNVKVEKSGVYITVPEDGWNTYPYNADIVKRFGEYHVNGLTITNDDVYITVGLFLQNRP